MGARVSDAMLRARAFIEGGMTPYKAAKAAGISQSAITKSKWNRERLAWNKQQNRTKNPP